MMCAFLKTRRCRRCFVSGGGRLALYGPLALTPVSATVFKGVPGLGQIEFVMNSNGQVTHTLLRSVEGDLRAARVADATP
jgi:hypothetical protein